MDFEHEKEPCLLVLYGEKSWNVSLQNLNFSSAEETHIQLGWPGGENNQEISIFGKLFL